MKRFFNDLKKYNSYAVHSAKANLKSEVANSYLNWLWWIFEPLAFMMIYTVIFGMVFDAREQYFPVFIFIGITMWDFFSRTLNQSVRIVKNNKPIVSKVYIPKYVLIVVRMYVNGFKMLISFGIIVVMMIVFQIPLTWNVLYIVPILAIEWIVTFGIATFLLHFGVFVEDLSNLVSIGLKMLFYMTGIFYNVSKKMGYPYGDIAFHANPMAYLLTSMRQALIYSTTPGSLFLLIWLVAGLLITATGVHLIYKNENSYVKVI